MYDDNCCRCVMNKNCSILKQVCDVAITDILSDTDFISKIIANHANKFTIGFISFDR